MSQVFWRVGMKVCYLVIFLQLEKVYRIIFSHENILYFKKYLNWDIYRGKEHFLHCLCNLVCGARVQTQCFTNTKKAPWCWPMLLTLEQYFGFSFCLVFKQCLAIQASLALNWQAFSSISQQHHHKPLEFTLREIVGDLVIFFFVSFRSVFC
jgi:hypothetical protein